MLKIKEISVKKMIIFLCAAMLLSLGLPAQVNAEEEYEVTELTGTGTITAESLNVRSGPSKDYSTVGKAKEGESYPVTGQADTGWYRIDYNGTQGYVSDKYVSVTLAEVPKEQPQEEEGEGPGQGGMSIFEMAQSSTLITGAVIGVVILILLISIGITVKKMLTGGDEEYDNEEYDGEYDDDEEDDVIYAAEAAEYEEDKSKEETEEEIEEEDYRLFIDPSYFEDESPYRTQETPDPPAQKTDKELEEAMVKLNELQKEIERIKQKKDIQF